VEDSCNPRSDNHHTLGSFMKKGDLVRFSDPTSGKQPIGVVVRIDDSHRQTQVDVLFSTGLSPKIWKARLEVVND